MIKLLDFILEAYSFLKQNDIISPLERTRRNSERWGGRRRGDCGGGAEAGVGPAPVTHESSAPAARPGRALGEAARRCCAGQLLALAPKIGGAEGMGLDHAARGGLTAMKTGEPRIEV